MIEIVAFVGDHYHPETPIREALEAALAAETGAGRVALRFEPVDRLDVVLAAEPDVVVLYKENRLDPESAEIRTWMTEERAAAAVRFVERGGGWMAWHSGLASYPEDGAYVRMLRGCFAYHPPRADRVRYLLEPGDPLTAAFGDATELSFVDEHYFVRVDAANTSVFLRSSSPDGESIAGWRHVFGSGRVVCLTPAHTREGLADVRLHRLLVTAVDWCSGKNMGI